MQRMNQQFLILGLHSRSCLKARIFSYTLHGFSNTNLLSGRRITGGTAINMQSSHEGVAEATTTLFTGFYFLR